MLILVRHGRTDANASGLLLGRLDPDLDEVGVGQAGRVAQHLERAAAATGRPIGRIVTSPLRRTRATAEAIAVTLGVEVTVDERWIELDYGEYDGMPLGEVPAEVWTRWRRDPSFAPPGGESLRDLGARVRVALTAMSTDGGAAGDEDVVVVSHVSPIKAAVAWALGTGEEVTWRMFLAPASISRVALTARGPSLHGFNDVSHLTHP